MPDFIAYGKIHIDTLVQVSKSESFLGGGGPQAVFGMCLWSDSVGFLTRSGVDIEPRFAEQIEGLGANLEGWKKFDDLPTPQIRLVYDENEYMVDAGIVDKEAWLTMQKTPIHIPDSYQQAKAVHFVTEWTDTPMERAAQVLRKGGALFSLEPLIDNAHWDNVEAMKAFFPEADIVTPDFPSASKIAGSDDPKTILQHWSTFGTQLVAVRDGARGSYVWSRDEDVFWHMPPVPVDEVVDPTGAGNAYGGGLCVGWVETQDARTAAAYGTIAAWTLLQVPGVPPITAESKQQARDLLQATIDAAKPL